MAEAKKSIHKTGGRDLIDVCLPFEKPVVEMEKKLRDLRNSSGEAMDLSGEIKSVEKKMEK